MPGGVLGRLFLGGQRWWESAGASWRCAPCTQSSPGRPGQEGPGAAWRIGGRDDDHGLSLRASSFLFQAICAQTPEHSCTTMTGLLKRKFDQLDEDDSSLCSSSSLSSSGRHSLSCSPSSSVSPAWDSEEEGPWHQMPLPDRDFCGSRSFTRESPLPPWEPHHTPSSFLKMKLGGLRESHSGLWRSCPCGFSGPPRLPSRSTFQNTVVAQECPLSRGTWARLDSPLTSGLPCFEIWTFQDGALQSGPRPRPPGSSLLFQFRFSSSRLVRLPAVPLQLHTPHCSAERPVRPVPLLSKRCLASPECSASFLPSYFSGRCDSDSKLTKGGPGAVFLSLTFYYHSP